MTRTRSAILGLLALFVGIALLRGFVGSAGLHGGAEVVAREFDFGFEQGHIAGNIARGLGYSVKFGDAPPIPTAWASPMYPLMLAELFRVFGVFTFDSAIAVIWLNAIFHGGIAVLVWLVARRLAPDRPRVAPIAVAMFLILPPGWQFLHWAWCIHLLALLILLHVYVLLREFASPARFALAAGASLGLAMLTDGAAIMIAPVTLVVLCQRCIRSRVCRPAVTLISDFRFQISNLRLQGSDSRIGSGNVPVIALRSLAKPRVLPTLVVFALAWAIVVAPWAVRNGLVLGSWSPLRGMLGAALWMGNHPGTADEDYHGVAENPWHNAEAAARFIALGERGFDDDCKSRFFAELRRNPSRFVQSCGMRTTGFWLNEWWIGWRGYPWNLTFGTILSTLLCAAGALFAARTGGAWRLLVAVVVLFPLPYYVTFLSYGRYRFPIEPVMYLLAAGWVEAFIARTTTLQQGSCVVAD